MHSSENKTEACIKNSTHLNQCVKCGCHNNDACHHDDHGNCWWLTPYLCSHCYYWPGQAIRYSLLLAKADAKFTH